MSKGMRLNADFAKESDKATPKLVKQKMLHQILKKS